MVEVTVITPVGLAHRALVERAIASVKNQTLLCKHLVMLDADKRGPGALRNQMLKQVATEFVSFLDADDWLETSFAADTVEEYRRIGGNRYIFTDWFDDGNRVIETPCLNGPDGRPISVPERKPYCGGTWHVLTTLIPTEWVRAVGGFDEELPAVEDTEFYLKLNTTHRCGHRLQKALFHYSPGGGRAATFNQDIALRTSVMQMLSVKYGGRMCCGDDEDRVLPPIGQRQPEDVLARALWRGNREETGRVTRRIYARMSFPKTTWVDPRDVAQAPDLWQPVQMNNQPIGIRSLKQMAQSGMAAAETSAHAVSLEHAPLPTVTAKPNIDRLLTLASKSVHVYADPVFVFSDKEYPSYYDIRRLAELSGFKTIPMSKIDAFAKYPYIVVTPEPVPNLEMRARVICWQLEYGGDYADNYSKFNGEIWASDRAWSEQHGAKFVLMGSHPSLSTLSVAGSRKFKYDVTMLGYMVPRRQAIKDKLADLRWPIDYPGHGTAQRDMVLRQTKVMLHVHQHEGQPWIAPQRLAVAAAYKMPVVMETPADPIEERYYTLLSAYSHIDKAVRTALNRPEDGENLYQYLCVERTFKSCVEEALKQ